MKKIILSVATIVLFGLYSLFIRSGDISAQLSKLNPVPDNSVEMTTSGSGKVTKSSNCVYIPYEDDESSEDEKDDEDAG